jgi:uncharacterized membrane protein (DUF4010 family)
MGPLAQSDTATSLGSALAGPAAAATSSDVYETFGKVATAILLGLLVGLEREWSKATDKALFAGIRTFPFIALLGCISAMIGTEQGARWFFGAAYVGFSMFVAANHFVAGAVPDRRGLGTTTEITSMLVFLFGGLVYWGHVGLAAALTVAVTVILSIKQPLHELAQKVESQDIYATLKLAVVSIIVLPLLPDKGIQLPGVDALSVVNPRKVWLLVVLVSGIAFVGYVSTKVVRPDRGITITGLLGGIVSSTAVAIGMAERSHEDERLAPQLALAVVLSSTVLFIRTVVEVLFVQPSLAGDLFAPLAGATIFGVAASAYLWFRGARTESEAIPLRNPFSLVSAVKFGLLFAIMLVVSKVLIERFDRPGVFLAAGIGGLVDARPIALSVASLSAASEIARHDAVAAVMLGTLSNTVMKCGWALLYGAPAFRRLLLPAVTLLCLGGVIATALVVLYGAAWFR